MTITIDPVTDAAVVAPVTEPKLFRKLVRQRRFQIGLVLLGALLVVLLFGPYLAPYSYKTIGVGLPGSTPNSAHLLGIDAVGRDVWSRLLVGGRRIVAMSVAADAIALAVAVALGMAAARRGGWVATVVTRGVDVILAVPPLLMIFLLVSVYGNSALLVLLVTVLTILPSGIRMVRGMSDAALHSEYVQAAEARGESTWYILTGEVLPNIARPLLALAALGLSGALAIVASISFLGIGARPPAADWGLMVAENDSVILANPWAVLSPAIAMALLVLAVTLMADALADVVAGGRAERRPRRARFGRGS
jgi:peptide/nickel transport system permease protein